MCGRILSTILYRQINIGEMVSLFAISLFGGAIAIVVMGSEELIQKRIEVKDFFCEINTNGAKVIFCGFDRAMPERSTSDDNVFFLCVDLLSKCVSKVIESVVDHCSTFDTIPRASKFLHSLSVVGAFTIVPKQPPFAVV